MNGYLMQEQDWVAGEDLFVESFSPENSYGVVFEDDGETAFFYAVEKDKTSGELRVLDALHIHESNEDDPEPATAQLKIIWSKDWLKVALVIDDHVHALFDFEAHGGYNINEFPPPNDFWTQGDRKLSNEMIRQLF
ncbi:DUF2251 domain-containing protein [Puia dinghuensis]|uniref:DUF2251 domain-containing protein n=1 Tax=Puia dinghuensis TaxID=1792502 RepID=A0A8J2UFV5_9BACT|nr:DUF2251 domain-containing protein [Puia dinghuensis]GGB10054.1 hypothetical protein GCM10011511_36990 [Puia dinghuensis]